MTIRSLSMSLLTVSLLGGSALAKKPGGPCPDAVKAAVTKAFPGGTRTGCHREVEDGKAQFEVNLTRKDHTRVEIDVAPDGTITQVEEKIAVAKVPAAVMTAFAAKYPKAKVTRAEKQVRGDSAVFYELAFAGDNGRREATFSEAGAFVEEE